MTENLMPNWPKIQGAKGIVWREQRGRLECRWQADQDKIKRGWNIKSVLLWQGRDGAVPDEVAESYIADRSSGLQEEMRQFGLSEEEQPRPVMDGSVADLCDKYLLDNHSPINNPARRYATKRHYRVLIGMLKRDLGDMMLSEMRGRDVLDYHARYISAGKVVMGSTLIGMLRMVTNFGCAILEDQECARLSNTVLNKIKVQGGKHREVALSFEQASAIIEAAHAAGLHSIALAQAFQFECTLRQKDVVGEWIPLTERGDSYVINQNTKKKWLCGIMWEEIDSDHILHHVTSKRQKLVEPDLKLAPLVVEEFKRFDLIPAKGPIIVSERTGIPWEQNQFAKAWRKLADEVGIPKHVRNMDSRAGAITEATEADMPLDKVRKAATHSNISQTQAYSRGDAEAIADVMRGRVASRTKREN